MDNTHENLIAWLTDPDDLKPGNLMSKNASVYTDPKEFRMTTLPIPMIKRPLHPTGIWNWITTIDHKKIGVLYGATAFINFLIGGIEAILIRAQLAGSNADIISPEVYNQLFTMHGTTMIFLAIMPLSAAFFNYVIPLQIGARDVAFPRLNAFSYWVFLAGTIIVG